MVDRDDGVATEPEGLLETLLGGRSACLVDEAALEKIIAAVGIPPKLVDVAGLQDDLSMCVLANLGGDKEKPRPSRSARKVALKSLSSHAEKLLDALGDNGEHLLSAVRDDYEARTFLRVLLRLIGYSRQKRAAVNAEVNLNGYMEMFFLRKKSAAEVILNSLAPIFERRFKQKATYSSREGKDGDRTPRGPFVNFVIAVNRQLHLVSANGTVSPHTIAKAIDGR